MLCSNCFDLELQRSNIEWGSGIFSTVYSAIKRVVLFGALKVLLKDNVATDYVDFLRGVFVVGFIRVSQFSREPDLGD